MKFSALPAASAAEFPAVLITPKATLDSWARQPPFPDETLRRVRGSRCADKASLFGETSAALQFPSYFADHWDSFSECVTDVTLLHTRLLAVIFTDADKVLEGSPFDFGVFLTILRKTVEPRRDPEGQPRLIRFYLHCERDRATSLKSRLATAGAPQPLMINADPAGQAS